MRYAYRTWLATFVRRWHSNPDMCHTIDPVGGHSGRVALLVLQLDPEASRDLLIAALVHDLGEYRTGDMSYDAKKRYPKLAEQLALQEDDEIKYQGIAKPRLNARDAKLLKVCDWLDSYLWAEMHVPRLVVRKDWRQQKLTTINYARDIGLAFEVEALLGHFSGTEE